jgi:hypothetical protein
MIPRHACLPHPRAARACRSAAGPSARTPQARAASGSGGDRGGGEADDASGAAPHESTPFFATARLWDDGIIDPRDTRSVVGIALSTAYNARVEGTTSWGVFRH